MITPLQPRESFTGPWRGQGELRPRSLLRWLVGNQQVRYQGRTIWLSERVWLAVEEFHLSGAGAIPRTTFIQWVAPLAPAYDLRSVAPLDTAAVCEAVAGTGRLLVVDEDYEGFGLSGELAAIVAQSGIDFRYARVCTQATIPYARSLEDQALPSVGRIGTAALALMGARAP